MKRINENRIYEIVDKILKENYYADMLGDGQDQYRRKVMTNRSALSEKLVDAVMQVLATECPELQMRRQVLSLLLDPIVGKVYRYYKG